MFGIVERRLDVPHALELPRVLRAVVPLVRRERLAGFGRRVVDELVALALGHAVGRRRRLAGGRARLMPRFAAVVGALNDLPEPAARLRRVDAVRINGRTLQMIDLPAAEVRAVDVPLLALAVGRENERAFPRADENSYAAHVLHRRRRLIASRHVGYSFRNGISARTRASRKNNPSQTSTPKMTGTR